MSDLQLQLEALSPADQCLVHRYLYYILSRPVLCDHDYDRLERMASNDPDTPVDHLIHKPGSDLEDSYPKQIQLLATAIVYPELQ